MTLLPEDLDSHEIHIGRMVESQDIGSGPSLGTVAHLLRTPLAGRVPPDPMDSHCDFVFRGNDVRMKGYPVASLAAATSAQVHILCSLPTKGPGRT
jgi:hypothetical protein